MDCDVQYDSEKVRKASVPVSGRDPNGSEFGAERGSAPGNGKGAGGSVGRTRGREDITGGGGMSQQGTCVLQ